MFSTPLPFLELRHILKSSEVSVYKPLVYSISEINGRGYTLMCLLKMPIHIKFLNRHILQKTLHTGIFLTLPNKVPVLIHYISDKLYLRAHWLRSWKTQERTTKKRSYNGLEGTVGLREFQLQNVWLKKEHRFQISRISKLEECKTINKPVISQG